eukprot:GEMP01135088.1.p1 GENE.GEMP01135088.1~~GEMP01135088.1.p1  ORF type:complete len:107 (-),score=3.18 GEMP01135088.1:68-388(-)
MEKIKDHEIEVQKPRWPSRVGSTMRFFGNNIYNVLDVDKASFLFFDIHKKKTHISVCRQQQKNHAQGGDAPPPACYDILLQACGRKTLTLTLTKSANFMARIAIGA